MSANLEPLETSIHAYESALLPDELPYDFQQAQQQATPPPPKVISPATKLSLSLLGVALLLGICSESLLQATPWGLNIALLVSFFVLAISAVIRTHKPDALQGGKWLAFATLFFGATFAWRDSDTLNGLSLLALLLLAGLTAWQMREGDMAQGTVYGYLKTLLFGAAMLGVGPAVLLMSDTNWDEIPREGWAKKIFALVRGFLIAIPLLLIFGGLFVAADSMYGNIVERTFNFDGARLAGRLIFSGFLAWLSAGFLRFLFFKSEPQAITERPQILSLGLIETATMLSLLDLLFASFVAVQFRYFFGGRANIVSGRGAEFAEYARHGFFELVWVSVLVLPLLLGVHWLLRKDHPRNEKIFRILAGIKLGLLFIIMISAMQRMRMYQIECGLTELRVYTMAFMGWLAIVFIWFAATVLRGSRARFAFGAVATGLAMIAALQFINPDALIARVNLQRAIAGKNFDAWYTGHLSADAVPEIIAAQAHLKIEERTALQNALNYRWSHYRFGEKRSWNWARQQAAQKLAGSIVSPE